MTHTMDYGRVMAMIEGLGGSAPDHLVHAPWVDSRNHTPSARLAGGKPYAWPAMAGAHVAVFGTPDKSETLGLIARAALAQPHQLSIAWGNDDGGKTLPKMLQQAGWTAAQESACHARFASITAPSHHAILDQWAAGGAPQLMDFGFTTQAGLFSYRDIDPASALLTQHLPPDLSGVVADFGCGWGYLTKELLKRTGITTLYVIDDDARAVACTTTNCDDPRLNAIWADVTQATLPEKLDAVVMNPPFHTGGVEDKNLGVRFIERAAQALKKKGTLYIVANRHLPYEKTLAQLFSFVTLLADEKGFKVIKAIV